MDDAARRRVRGEMFCERTNARDGRDARHRAPAGTNGYGVVGLGLALQRVRSGTRAFAIIQRLCAGDLSQ